MVSLHLSMCHSATSWPPKKQRKDSFDTTTRKALKEEMLRSLSYYQEVLGLVKAINRLFKNFSLDPELTRTLNHPVIISLVAQLRSIRETKCLLSKKTNQQYLACHEKSLSLSAKGNILTRLFEIKKLKQAKAFNNVIPRALTVSVFLSRAWASVLNSGRGQS